jgi:hypothetical protein
MIVLCVVLTLLEIDSSNPLAALGWTVVGTVWVAVYRICDTE